MIIYLEIGAVIYAIMREDRGRKVMADDVSNMQRDI